MIRSILLVIDGQPARLVKTDRSFSLIAVALLVGGSTPGIAGGCLANPMAALIGGTARPPPALPGVLAG